MHSFFLPLFRFTQVLSRFVLAELSPLFCAFFLPTFVCSGEVDGTVGRRKM